MNNTNNLDLNKLCQAILDDAEDIIVNKTVEQIDDVNIHWKKELKWLLSDEEISNDNITFLHCCRFLDIDPCEIRFNILSKVIGKQK